jgi:Putative auto-transporter adhesin, head GIN domain
MKPPFLKFANYQVLYGIVLITLFSLVTGCNKENAPDCFQSAGEDRTIVRDIEPFESIDISDYIQIELLDTNFTAVEITGPKNLLPEVITEVKDGKLIIRNDNTCNFTRSFKREITVRICSPEFRNIQNHGTGNLKSINTLNGNVFKLENRDAAGRIELDLDVDTASVYTHTGVCDVVMKGRAFKTVLFEQGVGYTDARNLQSDYTYINNSSLNDIYASARLYLFGYVKFSGNIYFSGNPTIDQEIDGQGRLIPI